MALQRSFTYWLKKELLQFLAVLGYQPIHVFAYLFQLTHRQHARFAIQVGFGSALNQVDGMPLKHRVFSIGFPIKNIIGCAPQVVAKCFEFIKANYLFLIVLQAGNLGIIKAQIL